MYSSAMFGQNKLIPHKTAILLNMTYNCILGVDYIPTTGNRETVVVGIDNSV